jgi:hypothetical protein
LLMNSINMSKTGLRMFTLKPIQAGWWQYDRQKIVGHFPIPKRDKRHCGKAF